MPGPEEKPSAAFGPLAVSARSFDEYRAMFALTDADLRRRILDCPAGAASLVAQLHTEGEPGEVPAPGAIACDPVYAPGTGDALTARAHAENDRLNRYVREHTGQYRWTYFADPDEHHRLRRVSVDRFAAHRRAHPRCYLPGALPHLPFADGAFDLVLSSHFLFSYADQLDLGFHRAALRELVRVSRDEVRVYPLAPIALATPYPHLDQLRAELERDGVHTAVAEVDYEFQIGGRRMLRCRVAGSRSGNRAGGRVTGRAAPA